MNKIIQYLESQLTNCETRQGHDDIIKQKRLNDDAILSARYLLPSGPNNGKLTNMYMCVKDEVADSISEDYRNWFADPSVALVFSFSPSTGEFTVNSYDSEAKERITTRAYYPTTIDGTYGVDQSDGNNFFETVGQVSDDEIVEALKTGKYHELATGEIKQSGKNMGAQK